MSSGGTKMTSANVSPVVSAGVVVEQPKRRDSHAHQHGHRHGRNRGSSVIEIEEMSRLRGLSSLSVANLIQIKANKHWWKCDCDVKFDISDCETNGIIFNALQASSCCCVSDGFHNIMIRDHRKTLVARVCYREQVYCQRKLVMAVYSPVDFLVATIEESSGFIVGSSEFLIRDSAGKPTFIVEYKHSPCSITRFCSCLSRWTCSSYGSNYKVIASESNSEIGKIMEKTDTALRLQFRNKLDITGKIILMGFCLGLIHKVYNQAENKE